MTIRGEAEKWYKQQLKQSQQTAQMQRQFLDKKGESLTAIRLQPDPETALELLAAKLNPSTSY